MRWFDTHRKCGNARGQLVLSTLSTPIVFTPLLIEIAHSSGVSLHGFAGAPRQRFGARRAFPTQGSRSDGLFAEGQSIAFPRVGAPVEISTSRRLYRHTSQDVCPWQVSFTTALREQAFAPREMFVDTDAAEGTRALASGRECRVRWTQAVLSRRECPHRLRYSRERAARAALVRRPHRALRARGGGPFVRRVPSYAASARGRATAARDPRLAP